MGFKRLARLLVHPFDQVYLFVRFLTRFYASMAEESSDPEPVENGPDGQRTAVLGPGPRSGWPPLRVPLPEDAEYRFTVTGLASRSAFWHSFRPHHDVVESFRTVLKARSIPFAEEQKGGHVRLRLRESGAEVRVAQPPSPPTIISIRQDRW